MKEIDSFFLSGLDDIDPKPKSIFVLLPFQNTLVFESILKPAAETVGLTCTKADDIFGTGAIMVKIAKNIKAASLIIADLSGRNPNVFYELGLAHSFRKKVILITQEEGDVPSDLKAFEYYSYDVCSSAKIDQFKNEIKKVFEDFVKSSTIPKEYKKLWNIQASAGNEQTISASFLKYPEGGCSIWVKVSEELMNSGANQYIISHAGNGGKVIKIEDEGDNEQDGAPKEPRKAYVDVFCIRSLQKKAGDSFGRFQFWCTDSSGLPNAIATTEKVDAGWHLFTATWSRTTDSIKFYINRDCIGTSPFQGWPEKIGSLCLIGTWPIRHKQHYLNTMVGNIRIYPAFIDYEEIVSILSKGPEDV